MARLKKADAAGVVYQSSAKDDAFISESPVTTDKAIRERRQAQAYEAQVVNRELDRAAARENKQQQIQQTIANNDLKRKQAYTRSDLKRRQDFTSLSLKKDADLQNKSLDKAHSYQKGTLEGEQLAERLSLELEQGYQSRLGNLRLSEVRFKSQIDAANLDTTRAAITGLVNLSKGFASLVETRERINAAEEKYRDQLDFFQGNAGAIVQQGEAAEQIQMDTEVITTDAVLSTTDDPILQDTLLTDQTEGRIANNNIQAGTLRFSSMLPGLLEDSMSSDVLIRFPDGRIGTAASARTAEEVEWAMSAHLGNIIKANGGLDNLSAAQLNNLYNSAVQGMSSTRSRWTQRIIDRKEQEVIDSGFDVFKEAAINGGDIGPALRSLADSYWVSGRYKSRSEATEAAIKDAQGLASNMNDGRGNRDLLDAISRTPMRMQNGVPVANSEAWTYAGDDLNEARNESFQDEDTRDAQAHDLITKGMYEGLAQAEDPTEKADIIKNSIAQLEDLGLYQEARELQGDLDNLIVPGNSEYVVSELGRQIVNGEAGKAEVERAFQLGIFGVEQRKGLLTLVDDTNATKTPKDPDAASIADAYTESATTQILVGSGAERDPITGEWQLADKQNSGIYAEDIPIIKEQVESDLNRTLNQALLARPDLEGPEKAAERRIYLQDVANKWMQDNVKSTDGKYYINPDGGGTDEAGAEIRKASRNRFRALTSNSQRLNQNNYESQGDEFLGRDFSRDLAISGNGEVPSQIRHNFNPVRGDILITEANLNTYTQEYVTNGTFNSRLQSIATDVGMTPFALLNQQNYAYGRTGNLTPPPIVSSMRISGDMQQIPMSSYTSIQGAQRLMQMNFPARGAAYLAGNIQQESGWNGMRPSWDDVGAPAGGLVSWRAGRLQAIENYYQTPIQNISNEDQLAYLVYEMRTRYPSAYAVFMNPNSTDRQLQSASYAYWGWGEEGSRFGYARDILRQL